MTPPDAYLVFTRAPEAMIVFEDDGTIVAANERAAQLFGIPGTEMVGKNLSFFGPPGYDLRPGIRGLIAAGANRGEFRMTRGNGDIFDAEYSSRANVSPGQHVTIITDISDRKRLETSLRNSEQLFARSLIAAPVAIAVISAETGSFTLVNEHFLEMTGYWRSEVIGNTVAQLGLWADDGSEAHTSETDHATSTKPVRRLLRLKDGATRHVLASLARVQIGDQVCDVLVATDFLSGA